MFYTLFLPTEFKINLPQAPCLFTSVNLYWNYDLHLCRVGSPGIQGQFGPVEQADGGYERHAVSVDLALLPNSSSGPDDSLSGLSEITHRSIFFWSSSSQSGHREAKLVNLIRGQLVENPRKTICPPQTSAFFPYSLSGEKFSEVSWFQVIRCQLSGDFGDVVCHMRCGLCAEYKR